jgi:hypothetical protein
MLDARIEIDERSDHAGLDDRLADRARTREALLAVKRTQSALQTWS